MDKKITKIEKFAMIREILESLPDVNDMLLEFVDAESAALTRKSAKAKARASEKKTELDSLALSVLDALTQEPKTRDELAEAIGDSEVTPAKVGARLNKLVEMGYADRTEIPSVTPSGKKTTRKAYIAVINAECEE